MLNAKSQGIQSKMIHYHTNGTVSMATKIALLSYPCSVHRFVKCMRALQLNRSLNEQCGIKFDIFVGISIGCDGFKTILTWNLVDSSIGPSFTVSVRESVCVYIWNHCVRELSHVCNLFNDITKTWQSFYFISHFSLNFAFSCITWFCWLCAFVWKRTNHPNEHADN